MSTKQILVLIVVALSVAGFFLLDLQAYLTFDYFQAQRESIVGAYEAHPIETAAIFFGIYVLVTGLSLPFAAVMTIVGGAIFGLVVGVLIISFASTIGATIAFLVSRTLLREWVQRRFAPQLKAINEGIERDGSFYLFSIRMVPLFPFVIVNLAMALTPMSTASFYVSSQLGMLAGTIVYVFAGTQVAQVHAAADLVSPGLLTAFAVLGLFPLVARKFTAEFFRRRRLRGHRRPPRFDNNVVVIGAGSAGLIASLIAATVKAKVTLIERDKMGGDCLNTGCVPSKTLLRSARVANTVREAVRYGIGAGPPHVDFPAVMERVRGVIRRIEPVDSVERYTGLGVECIAGEARVVDPWTVEVNGRRITTRAMILAAGAGPAVPPIPGLEDVGYLTSDTVWGLQSLPRRLLVMGAGPIGCELAQGFRRLGADVTLVDMMDRILPREDPEVSSLVAECFEREGIRVCTGHRATAFHAGEEGHVLEAEHGDERREFAFDRVLVAVGRRASRRQRKRGSLHGHVGPHDLRLWRRHGSLSVHAHGVAPGMVRRGQCALRGVVAIPGGLLRRALDHLHRPGGGPRGSLRGRGVRSGCSVRRDAVPFGGVGSSARRRAGDGFRESAHGARHRSNRRRHHRRCPRR
jgi:uncharacterized membrane protein YdjX (TVP38/TMEM64 family)/thioredoxin reductase